MDQSEAFEVTSSRKTAEERREELARVAIEHFALAGYSATSTEAIARDAGISQPYLFRLFRTKRELFIACYDAFHDRLREAFIRAGRGALRVDALQAMGGAYVELLQDRTLLLFQLQSYAACGDPVIQAHVRGRYGELVRHVIRSTEATPEQVWHFFASGMLLNVVVALDLESVGEQEEWARDWASPSRFGA